MCLCSELIASDFHHLFTNALMHRAALFFRALQISYPRHPASCFFSACGGKINTIIKYQKIGLLFSALSFSSLGTLGQLLIPDLAIIFFTTFCASMDLDRTVVTRLFNHQGRQLYEIKSSQVSDRDIKILTEIDVTTTRTVAGDRLFNTRSGTRGRSKRDDGSRRRRYQRRRYSGRSSRRW